MFPRLVPTSVSAKPGAANTLNGGKKATRRGGAKRTAKKKAAAMAADYRSATQSAAALSAAPSTQLPIQASNGNGNGNGYHQQQQYHEPSYTNNGANMEAMMSAMAAVHQQQQQQAPPPQPRGPPHPSHLVGVVDVSFLPAAGSPSKGKINYGKVEAIVPFAFGEEHMPPEYMSSPFAEPTPKPNNIKFGPAGPTVSFNHYLEPHEQRLIGGKWIRPPRAESLLHGGGLTAHGQLPVPGGQANGPLNYGTHFTSLVQPTSHSAPAPTRTLGLGSTGKIRGADIAGLTTQQAAQGGVPAKVGNGVVLEPLLPSFNFRAGSPSAMSLSSTKKETAGQKIARESKERKAKIQTTTRNALSPSPAPVVRAPSVKPQPVVAAAAAPVRAPEPVATPSPVAVEASPAPSAAEPSKE